MERDRAEAKNVFISKLHAEAELGAAALKDYSCERQCWCMGSLLTCCAITCAGVCRSATAAIGGARVPWQRAARVRLAAGIGPKYDTDKYTCLSPKRTAPSIKFGSSSRDVKVCEGRGCCMMQQRLGARHMGGAT